MLFRSVSQSRYHGSGQNKKKRNKSDYLAINDATTAVTMVPVTTPSGNWFRFIQVSFLICDMLWLAISIRALFSSIMLSLLLMICC